MKLTVLVALCAASSAIAAQPHLHAHRHAKKHGSPVNRRGDVTKLVDGPVVTQYMLNGEVLSAEEVAEGLKNGLFILLPEETPSSTSSPSTSTSKAAPSSTKQAAEFYEQKSSSSAPPPPPSSTKAPVVPTSTAPPPPAAPKTSAQPEVKVAAASSQGSVSGGSGVDSDFPSGSIKCSDFASVAKYGALKVDWLGLNGWIGIQNVPGFSIGAASISFISTAIKGDDCAPNSYCSYACPAGYQKTQWPSVQGSTGQSIGGLYCNPSGFLEISNTKYSKLCMAGTGGVKIQNKLASMNVALCRTDYPGTESETVPLDTHPGNTYEVTCPDINNYYNWKGLGTSAQLYLNVGGVSVSEACQWGSAPTASNPVWAGNWAPVNVGVGKGADGNIYTSLFPNNPTNSMVTAATGLVPKLNFNVEIVGGSIKCSYTNGEFLMNGVSSPTGCTVGGPVTFVLTDL